MKHGIAITSLFILLCTPLFSLSLKDFLIQNKLVLQTGSNNYFIDYNQNNSKDNSEPLLVNIEDFSAFCLQLEKDYAAIPNNYKTNFVRIIYESKKNYPEWFALANKLFRKYGAELSVTGIHPISKYKEYFVPDSSGNTISNPTIINFYKSGKIKDIVYSHPNYFNYQLKNGLTILPRSIGFYENGQISGFQCDDRYVEIEYDNHKYMASDVGYFADGTISGFSLKRDSFIEIAIKEGHTVLVNGVHFYPSGKVRVISPSESPTLLPNGTIVASGANETEFDEAGNIIYISIRDPVELKLKKDQSLNVLRMYALDDSGANTKISVIVKEDITINNFSGKMNFDSQGRLISISVWPGTQLPLYMLKK